MEGFESMLEACQTKYGAIDGPSTAIVDVYMEHGEMHRFDAVGIIEQAGVGMLMGFNWVKPEEINFESLADRIDESVTTAKELFEGPVLILEFNAPLERVLETDIDMGVF